MAVTPNMKIAEVLKRHPQLLEVLIAQSPHFSRLKNPILRRIQGRMVTVAQAAAMAGLEPAALVRTLNAAVGEETAEVGPVQLGTMAGTPPPPWVETAPVAVTVDAREDQRRKEEPFAKIMAGVNQIGDGQVLLLRNTFEPLPLYDVLSKRGFAPWARQVGVDDWEIYFFKVNGGRLPGNNGNGKLASQALTATANELASCAAATAVAADGAAPATDQPAATITVDVRDLVPPQPMMRILEALDRLQPGQTLLVHHVRRPAYLYPRLAELGCTHETRELGPDKVEIVIRKG